MAPGIQSQLLASILQTPDEDAPRLVYADWLSDRGDPYGDFIHQQLRLARMDEADPAYSALFAQTERAWTRRQREWTAPLRELDPNVELAARRGVVEHVSLRLTHKRPPLELAEMALRAPLRSAHIRLHGVPLPEVLVSLEGTAITELHLEPGYDSEYALQGTAGGLRQLRALRVSAYSLESHQQSQLARLLQGASLRELCLRFRGLDAGFLLGLSREGALQELESLDLMDTDASPTAVLPLLARTRPRRLGLPAGYGAPTFSLEDLALEALHLRDESDLAWMFGPRAPAFVPHLRHLTVGRAPPESLASIPFTRLTRLRLEHVDPRRDAPWLLLRSPHLRHLRRLEIGGGGLGEEGIRALISSPHLSGLVQLSLAYLDDRCIALLAGWPGLAHVCRLSLPYHRLSAEGFRSLMASPHLDPALLEVPLKGQHKKLREQLHTRFGDAIRL